MLEFRESGVNYVRTTHSLKITAENADYIIMLAKQGIRVVEQDNLLKDLLRKGQDRLL
jgi:ABC-type multidrug transport system ATPase subunit